MPADVNSVNEEIRNEAKKVLQSKKGMEKVKYFVYYYKVHFIVAVAAIALIGSVISWYANMKDAVLSVIVVNGKHFDIYDYQGLIDDFGSTIEYDEKEEEVKIDADFLIDVHAHDQYNQTNIQKVFLNVTSKDLDVLLCDEDFMRLTRAQDCAMDLSKVLPKEMLEKYEDKLVWYDFPKEEVGEEYYEEDYAGRNEAVAIDVTEFAKVKNTDMYQGNTAYAIIIPNTEHLDHAIEFLEYLDK